MAYMRAGVDVVVIADHNTHSAIEPIRGEVERLRTELHPDYRDLVLFPAVEVTTDGGFHLLGIFDPTEPAETVNGVLHNVGYTGIRGSSSATARDSVFRACEVITGAHGLAIPAHADSARGVFGMDARSLRELIDESLIEAVELVGDSRTAEALGYGWAPVLGSDTHHLDGSNVPNGVTAKYPGSHFTWVKMERPDLSGLRLAFTDPNQSIIRSVESESDPNLVAHNRLISVSLVHADEEVELNLSPWLNSLIGGRGVGKSTMLEVMRLALHRFEELPGNLKTELAWFAPSAPTPSASRFWDATTAVEVTYAKGDRLFRLSWHGSSPGDVAIYRRENDAWQPDTGSVVDRFPVLIYSQKQIYETARDVQSLLSVIDAQPQIQFAEWEAERDLLNSRYAEALQRIAANEVLLATEARVLGELADTDARIGELRQFRDSGLADELQALLNADSARREAERHISALEERLAEAGIGVADALSKSTDAGHLTEAEMARASAASLVLDELLRLSELLLSTRIQAAQVNERAERISAVRAELTRPADGEASGGVDFEAEFTELSSRRVELQGLVHGIEAAKLARVELQASASAISVQAREHRGELTRRRKEYIASLDLAATSLRLDLFAVGDSSSLEADLRGITQIASSFDRFFSGEDGIRALLTSPPQHPAYAGELDKLKDLLKSLRRNGQSSPELEGAGVFVEGRMFPRLQSLDPASFDAAIDLWFPADMLRIRYRPEGESNFRALEQGSPGQKTATLLALILRMSTDPLILDQPEDDLDNELITDLVVTTLKTMKRKRQVVVVTHNANVVVNADSENVMVVRHGVVPVVAHQGSIQATNVREAVCTIMEGGEQAFKERYQRLVR
nr:hypothetical protein [Agromyces ramosus]